MNPLSLQTDVAAWQLSTYLEDMALISVLEPLACAPRFLSPVDMVQNSVYSRRAPVVMDVGSLPSGCRRRPTAIAHSF
jgi:hypothetical protein